MTKPYLAKFESNSNEIVEYYDDKNRLLMLGPRFECQHYKLRIKVVGVILHDSSPVKSRKYYICKRKLYYFNYQPAWDIAAIGYVQRGEAVLDCAYRILLDQTGLEGIPLTDHICFYPDPKLSIKKELLQVNIFMAGSSYGLPNSGGVFVDIDELLGLAREMAEELTPALHWMIKKFLPKV